jgi:TPR repeat protein
MVELARALEMGDGVVRDDVRAAALYEKTAQDRPAFTSIYAPPVRLGGSGRVIMIPNADGGPGDAETKYRLGRMLVEGRGIGQDIERGRKLMAAAQRQGFQP